MSDPTQLEAPAVLRFSAQVPRYAEAAQGLLRFLPLGSGRAFTQAMASLADVRHDVVLAGPWVNTFVYTYTLPAGFALVETPPEVLERSDFGELTLVTKASEGKIVVEATMTLREPVFQSLGTLRSDRGWARLTRRLGRSWSRVGQPR